MTNTAFAVVVRQLADVQPNQLVEQLYKLFLTITAFSPDEAVAAWQSLELVEQLSKSEEGAVVIKSLKGAIHGHMCHLAAQESRHVGQNGPTATALRTRFRSTTRLAIFI